MSWSRLSRAAGFSAAAIFATNLAIAQTESEVLDRAVGEAQFKVFCAACHEGALLEAPQLAALSQYSPQRIVTALESGSMATSGMVLSALEKRQVAYYLTGQIAPDTIVEAAAFACTPSRNVNSRFSAQPSWNGWGANLDNTRHQPNETILNPDNVANLELKWTFAFPDTTRVRAQPLVTPQVTYIGSQAGDIYALDTKTGCPLWTFRSDSEVRGALFLDTDNDGAPQTLFFGDFQAQAYAINAQTGELIWKTLVHDNPMAVITGSVISSGDSVVVPVSSLEIIPASRAEYECCSFRGAITAINKVTGEIKWRTYTVDEPKPTGKSTVGTQWYGPSGAPSWSGPSIDVKRNLVYATTGQNYSSPATETSDAVIAFDLDSGEIKWVSQATANDAWNGACSTGTPNCPEENGPDYDIGASAMIATTDTGRDLLIVGQKSGMVYALDPDNQGKLVWQQRVGSGGTMGGVHYGMTTYNNTAYVGVSDLPTNNPYNVGEGHPGLHALNLQTGDFLWRTALPNVCEESPFLCFQGISAAISSSPGLIFAGGLDGMFRAFSASSGEILWETNTRKPYPDANGIPAQGGSIEADGPVIADGRVYITSGYEKWAEAPGNVLLVFGLPD